MVVCDIYIFIRTDITFVYLNLGQDGDTILTDDFTGLHIITVEQGWVIAIGTPLWGIIINTRTTKITIKKGVDR